jgi:GntR family transcriptional regulator, transcriptional repressor for pyruvate dehydrogenase complex
VNRRGAAILDRLTSDIVGWSVPSGGGLRAIWFAPLDLPRQSEEIADRISAAIREGALRQGDRLPSERALAEQFGSSRPTIREAVRQLADTGILVVRPGSGGGIFVADELVPARPMTLKPGEMDEIIEARRLFMPRICETAALYAGDDDFERMREAIAFGRAVLAPGLAELDRRAKLQLNISCIRFDLAVAQSTGNRLLVQVMRTLLDWLEPLRLESLVEPGSGEISMRVQEETMAALQSGDPATVNAVLDRRMALMEDAWQRSSGRMLRHRRRAG